MEIWTTQAKLMNVVPRLKIPDLPVLGAKKMCMLTRNTDASLNIEKKVPCPKLQKFLDLVTENLYVLTTFLEKAHNPFKKPRSQEHRLGQRLLA